MRKLSVKKSWKWLLIVLVVCVVIGVIMFKPRKTLILSENDIHITAQFYEVMGDDEKTAQENAYSAMKKREALYKEAISNGYTVTDEEIKDYVENLKKLFDEASNKDDIMKLMSVFQSEDEYWEYLMISGKKDLPIQKLTEALSEQYNREALEKEPEKTWNEYIDAYTQKLVEKYNFKVEK